MTELARSRGRGQATIFIRRRILDVDGLQVHVRSAGSGPPLLLLHDVPGSSANMLPEINDLGQSYSILAPDLPGHGLSSPLTNADGSIHAYVEWLISVERAVDWPTGIVHGYGLGGVLGIAFADRADARVEKLILSDVPTAHEGRVGEAYLEGMFPPMTPRIDGGHIVEAWDRVRRACMFSPWFATTAKARTLREMSDPWSLHRRAADVLDGRDERRGFGGAALRLDWAPVVRNLRGRIVVEDKNTAEGVAPTSSTVSIDAVPRVSRSLDASLPKTRRGVSASFIDGAFGQIHTRFTGESGVPLLMLHQSPGSARTHSPLIEAFARTRRVIAPDTLGNGHSDPPPADDVDIAFYAESMADLLDRLSLPVADVWGSHTGALIGMELAIRHPGRVRALGMEGITLFDSAETADLLANYTSLAPMTPSPYGTHLLSAWHMRRDMSLFWPWYRQTGQGSLRRDLPSAASLHQSYMDIVSAIDTWHIAYRAAFSYPTAAQLHHLATRTLIAASSMDPLSRFLGAAQRINPSIEIAEIPGLATPEGAQQTVERFLEFFDRTRWAS